MILFLLGVLASVLAAAAWWFWLASGEDATESLEFAPVTPAPPRLISSAQSGDIVDELKTFGSSQ
jgi:hypothetical protein